MSLAFVHPDARQCRSVNMKYGTDLSLVLRFAPGPDDAKVIDGYMRELGSATACLRRQPALHRVFIEA